MSREHLDDAPQRFLAEPRVRDHAALLTRAIAASAPAARTPGGESAGAFPRWLGALHGVVAALQRQLDRRPPEGAGSRPATGGVWATRAVGESDTAAANDANYSSAA